ncbi:MAG: cupin domain-containing protein [Nevskia sp.]|nr:cupin domain-containing protein [Nevskia sp.]
MRRLVTGHTPSGKSVFVSDGAPPFHVAHEGGGLQITKLWGTEGVPVVPSPPGDPTLTPHQFFPAPGGTRFLVVRIPPAAEAEAALQRGVDMDKAAQKMLDQLPGLGEVMEHDQPGMHTSQTIDYGIIMAGEVDLELDDGVKKRLKAGDFYVQSGTRHAWHNPGTEPCILVAVVVGAGRKA